MKPYSVEIDVTTRWTVEIHADSEDEAWNKAENMSADEIEEEGDFKELRPVVVNDVGEITNVD